VNELETIVCPLCGQTGCSDLLWHFSSMHQMNESEMLNMTMISLRLLQQKINELKRELGIRECED
jgi:hypothetical protein